MVMAYGCCDFMFAASMNEGEFSHVVCLTGVPLMLQPAERQRASDPVWVNVCMRQTVHICCDFVCVRIVASVHQEDLMMSCA